MLFKNQKSVISILYYLLGENNFTITGSFVDHVHLKGENLLVNDLDILIEDEGVLENLNPYFTINKISDVNESSIPHVKRVFVYYIMNVKVEIYLVDGEGNKNTEKTLFLNLPLKVASIIGRKKGLINFIALAKKNKDSKRILKHSRKLKQYVSNKL